MILGLDISTSITGYTILDRTGCILACEHIDLRKEKNFFKKIYNNGAKLNLSELQLILEQDNKLLEKIII